jgi:P27 family predicted phage terminase small subunit
MKGRRRQPTKVKEMKGTLDKRWSNEESPIPAAQKGRLDPPVALTDDAMKLWDDACKWLKEIDMLHGIDSQSLAAYCREMAMYHKCMDIVDKQGAVIPFENGRQEMTQINPAYKAAKIAFDNAMKVADKFGFNPSSRSHLNLKAVEPDSPIMRLLTAANG